MNFLKINIIPMRSFFLISEAYFNKISKRFMVSFKHPRNPNESMEIKILWKGLDLQKKI